jgi:ABC-2 type transport system permease protein
LSAIRATGLSKRYGETLALDGLDLSVYGLVTVAFLWQLVGSLLGATTWLADLTPFAHVGLVPTQPFRVVAAGVMLAIGAASALAAIGVFRRRDLLGA